MKGKPERVQDLLEGAHAALSQSHYDEAVQLAREAVDLNPLRWASWCELGTVCGYARREAQMEDAFEHALSLAVTDDEELETWFARGNAENNCGQWTDARRSFELVVESNPESSIPWRMLGMVLRNMGGFIDPRYFEEAQAALDRAAALAKLECE
jgi:tetratricopeptide (TPR) repeat protein